MKTDQLEYFRRMLTDKVDELNRECGKAMAGMAGEKENLADPNDRASEESEWTVEFRIRERERNLVLKIREAIKRIDEGTFGVCEECGEPISLQRLKARPVTTYCIDCKTQEERRQKMRGLVSVPMLSFAD